MKRIAVLDGSLHGKGGNTSAVIDELLTYFKDGYEIDYIELKSIADISSLEDRLNRAHGFIAATGTYWQSWGSPMQRFLEGATQWEVSDMFLGKPVFTIVTMHSMGGFEVMSRLQTTFNMLGTFIPPLCCMPYGQVNQAAFLAGEGGIDAWDLESISFSAHNFKEALQGTHQYIPWTVDGDEEISPLWVKRPPYSKK